MPMMEAGAVPVRHPGACSPRRQVGRWAQKVIENAEALESAAALLRRVEAQETRTVFASNLVPAEDLF